MSSLPTSWNFGKLGKEDDLQLDDDHRVQQQHGGTFTPVKDSPNTEKFTGVSIKQVPKEIDSGEILEFLIKCGLPESKAL